MPKAIWFQMCRFYEPGKPLRSFKKQIAKDLRVPAGSVRKVIGHFQHYEVVNNQWQVSKRNVLLKRILSH